MPQIELVILDFDGTLVDTAPDIVRATNLFLATKGLEALPESRIRAAIGLGLNHLLAEVYPKDPDKPDLNAQIYAEFTDVYAHEFLKSPALFEGALEFLLNWPGQIAIVSNKRSRFMLPIMKHLEIDTLPWAAVVGGDTLAQMKPHPEPFLHAIQAAGCRPEDAVMIGDGYPDVQGAANMNIPMIAVEFGYTPAELLLDAGATKSVENYFDLPDVIASLT